MFCLAMCLGRKRPFVFTSETGFFCPIGVGRNCISSGCVYLFSPGHRETAACDRGVESVGYTRTGYDDSQRGPRRQHVQLFLWCQSSTNQPQTEGYSNIGNVQFLF